VAGFSEGLDNFVNNVDIKARDLNKKVAIFAFGAIVKRSPVDTGRFRGNWQGSINSPVLSTKNIEQDTMPGGPPTATEQANLSGALTGKLGDDIYIANNLDYAEGLENGRSKQAPAGVLHITVNEIRSRLDLRGQPTPKIM
jgi:hypothetical protein